LRQALVAETDFWPRSSLIASMGLLVFRLLDSVASGYERRARWRELRVGTIDSMLVAATVTARSTLCVLSHWAHKRIGITPLPAPIDCNPPPCFSLNSEADVIETRFGQLAGFANVPGHHFGRLNIVAQRLKTMLANDRSNPARLFGIIALNI
jgi:hypothetical protein